MSHNSYLPSSYPDKVKVLSRDLLKPALMQQQKTQKQKELINRIYSESQTIFNINRLPGVVTQYTAAGEQKR